MTQDLMKDAVSVGGAYVSVDGRITGVTVDSLERLKSLWRAEWEKEGGEPACWAAWSEEDGFDYVSDFRELTNEHINNTLLEIPGHPRPYRLIPLFTRPSTKAELDKIAAEYLEKAAYDLEIAKFSKPEYTPPGYFEAKFLRNLAAKLKGE